MTDPRGNLIHGAASNRAGFASCALVDGVLLSGNGTKTINIVGSANVSLKPITAVDAMGNAAVDNTQAASSAPKPAVATQVIITNSSGQTCALKFVVQTDGTGRQLEVSRNPVYLLSGESFTVSERVIQVIETNTGAGAQTGLGVRYYAVLEPFYR